jgi:hypothetical protein
MLADLGVSFSDIFGNDRVVWVEGKTEAQCFDIIADADWRGRPPGVVFLPMPWASRVDASRADITGFFDVHARASEGAILWPSTVRFSFDRERRSKEEVDEIAKRSSDRASFLPRRMYENYLLHPPAIAAVLQIADAGGKHSESSVAEWIAASGNTYLEGARQEESVAKINAAALLKNLFSALTSARVEYDKVRHGIQLTSWLLENDPAQLSELRSYVGSLHE